MMKRLAVVTEFIMHIHSLKCSWKYMGHYETFVAMKGNYLRVISSSSKGFLYQ